VSATAKAMAKVMATAMGKGLMRVALHFAKRREKDAAGRDSKHKTVGRQQGGNRETRRRGPAHLPNPEPDNLSRRFLIERLSRLESSRQ
jgi:hypothetical protein